MNVNNATLVIMFLIKNAKKFRKQILFKIVLLMIQISLANNAIKVII